MASALPQPQAPPPPPPPAKQQQRPRRAGQWLRDVPDWARRGLRVAIAVWVLSFSAATLWMLTDEQEREWGDDAQQSLLWGAATPAVIAASPLIGKVVQLAGDRTLGTVIGGALGLLAFELVFHVRGRDGCCVWVVVCWMRLSMRVLANNKRARFQNHSETQTPRPPLTNKQKNRARCSPTNMSCRSSARWPPCSGYSAAIWRMR
jgi:hypothetical protein